MQNQQVGIAYISIGRIVHYVMEDGPNKGTCRPAIVTHVWGTGVPGNDTVQMTVFPDGTNDGARNDDTSGAAAIWRTSVRHYEEPDWPVRTWHWPGHA